MIKKNDIGKQITRKGVFKLKDRRVRNPLNLNFSNIALNFGTAYALNTLNRYELSKIQSVTMGTRKRITNFGIEKTIKIEKIKIFKNNLLAFSIESYE